MWKLVPWFFVAMVACKGKSEPAAQQSPKATPATGSAAVAKPLATKPKPAPLTKAQLADVRKHMRAGWAAQQDKRWADAVTEFEAGLKIGDGDPRLLSELGWSAMWAGDYVKAKKIDEQAVMAATDNKVKASGLYNLGLVQLKLNDLVAARVSFATSLVLRPNKTVEAELAKLGEAPPKAETCPADKSPCFCAVSAMFSSPGEDDLGGCHESTVTKSPVPGWKVYTIATGHGTSEQLLDEHHQVVTAIGGDDDRMRHMEIVELAKADIKTIGGHRVLWLEVDDRDHTQSMSEQDVVDEDFDESTVTICAVGDANTPTSCAVRDAPISIKRATDRSVMLDDGTLKDSKHEETETALDIAIAADGTVTVKLVKGSASEVAQNLLGPHKLW